MYIGYSADLETRLIAHNNGKARTTKYGRPWKMLYYEAYYSKEENISLRSAILKRIKRQARKFFEVIR